MRASNWTTALVLLGAVGCHNAADDQRKAEEAQAQADKKVAAAQTELTNAEVKAGQEVTAARAEADKKVAAAQSDIAHVREDFRHDVQTDLITLDKKIETLDAKSRTLTGKEKADLDANLRQIHAQRAEFDTATRDLATVSATAWSDTKARVQKQLDDLKALVARVS